MSGDQEKISEWINDLLVSFEEEDIGISLFTNHYQDEQELQFFSSEDQVIVIKHLKKLTRESKRHKKMLRTIVQLLEKEIA